MNREAPKSVRQIQIARALKAVRSSGLAPTSVEIKPDGSVEIRTSERADDDEGFLDQELKEWERKHG